MRIRVCFEKTEAGRYLSHLDLARTMERSLRRAKAPLAFSEGYNPHVKMAFASALAVGTTGRREYVDVDLSGSVHIQSFGQVLAQAFPHALAFVAAAEIGEGSKSLTAVVNLAVYRVTATISPDAEGNARAGIAAVQAATELWRKPKVKPGKKTSPAKEVRGLVRRLEIVSAADAPDDGFTLEMELIMKPDGQLRPQELWDMIGEAGGFDPPPIAICREALLILQDGKVLSPMPQGRIQP